MLKAILRIPFRFHPRREVATLLFLTGLAIVLFIGVTALSKLFHAQQGALAERWSSRGAADLAAGRFNDAVNDYRAALRYAEDSSKSRLGLAEALIGLNRTGEAAVYLMNLWEAEPENGVVNRELARIAAGNGDSRGALRYYHNAIYAIWTGDAEQERRNTRWELVRYLLAAGARTQAQSELIALAAEVGADPGQQLALGQSFLKVQDDQHALAAFRQALNIEPHSQPALAGAGAAAFGMGDYPRAQDYLRAAVEGSPADRDSANLLDVADEVIRLDPFRRQISDAERDQAVMGVFNTAGERLLGCPAAANATTAAGSTLTLNDAWAKLKPQVTERDLRRNQDVVNHALNLAFAIERQAGSKCGSGSPADAALLLISNLHEGS
jgi:tetratricopeptide (TPR) repeat protein